MNNDEAEWIKDNVEDTIVETEGDFEGEVYLSTDGKNTVHIKSSTKDGRRAGLSWAKAVYDRLRNTYGTKQSQSVREYAKEGQPDLGRCKICNTPNILSKKGKPYCPNKCWLK